MRSENRILSFFPSYSQCSANIYLWYHIDSYKVFVYKIKNDHDHLDEKVRGIDDNDKKCIEELYTECGMSKGYTDRKAKNERSTSRSHKHCCTTRTAVI